MYLPRTPHEIQMDLAKRLRTIRRGRKHSRQKACEVSGVPTPTIRRFETTGQISLRQFLMLTSAYGDPTATEALLSEPGPSTMDELLATHQKST